MKHIPTFEDFVNESQLNELETDKARDNYLKEMGKLFSSIKIQTSERVRKEDEVKFVSPFLNLSGKFPETDKGLKQRIKWLKGITFIDIEIKSRRTQGYQVFYSGTIKTDYGTEEFKDIDNGFSIGMG